MDSGGLAHFWGRLREALAGKQDRLSGQEGQLAGFDTLGRAAAVDTEFVTASELDAAIAAAVTGAMEGEY